MKNRIQNTETQIPFSDSNLKKPPYVSPEKKMGLPIYDETFLIAAVILVSIALIFYSVGVWSERMQENLKGWHVLVFSLALACHAIGTTFLTELLRLTGHDNRPHTVFGSMAIFLLLIHTLWAFRSLRKGSHKARHDFSRYSVILWCIWLIPYFVSLFWGMLAETFP